MDTLLTSSLILMNVMINVGGTYLLKQAAASGNPICGILGCVCYVLAAALFVSVVKEQPLALVAVSTSVLSLAASIMIGVFVFKESLSWIAILGVVLALISVVLISLPVGTK